MEEKKNEQKIPKCACGRVLHDVKPTASPDFVFGKCIEHKDQLVKTR